MLNESTCRRTLISILESAGSSLNESSRSLLDQKDMFEKLDDLIHNEHMVQAHQSFDL